MSQTDWQFIIGDPSRPYFNQNNTGSAVEHSSLSNPITSSGDWCRSFFPASNIESWFSLIPINNSDLTSSSGYQYGYAYSIRCWFRHNVNAYDNKLSIVFKGSSTLEYNQYTANRYESGYVLTAGNSLSLTCRRNVGALNVNDILDPSDPSFNNVFQKNNINSSTLAINEWHRIRMDITPIFGSYDRITIYTGSQDDTWLQQYTVDISRTKTAAYVPWANNPNGDGASAAGTGYMGIKAGSYNSAYGVFIDQFEVYRELVISP